MSPALPKLAGPLAPLLPRLELEPRQAALVVGVNDVVTALERLMAAGAMAEAVRLVAHAFPKREAVWWACMCARAVPDPSLPPEDIAALDGAETWVRKQDEQSRRDAMMFAQRTRFRTAEAWAAVGAFWSGGSMAPEGQPEVPPAPHMTGIAVAGGIILAGTRLRPERSADRFTRFLTAARDIAVGGAGRIPPETH